METMQLQNSGKKNCCEQEKKHRGAEWSASNGWLPMVRSLYNRNAHRPKIKWFGMLHSRLPSAWFSSLLQFLHLLHHPIPSTEHRIKKADSSTHCCSNFFAFFATVTRTAWLCSLRHIIIRSGIPFSKKTLKKTEKKGTRKMSDNLIK